MTNIRLYCVIGDPQAASELFYIAAKTHGSDQSETPQGQAKQKASWRRKASFIKWLAHTTC